LPLPPIAAGAPGSPLSVLRLCRCLRRSPGGSDVQRSSAHRQLVTASHAFRSCSTRTLLVQRRLRNRVPLRTRHCVHGQLARPHPAAAAPCDAAAQRPAPAPPASAGASSSVLRPPSTPPLPSGSE